MGSALALPLAGTLTDRHEPGPVTRTGAGLLLVTTVPFLLPGMLATSALMPILVARGIGMALAQMPVMIAAYASVAAA